MYQNEPGHKKMTLEGKHYKYDMVHRANVFILQIADFVTQRVLPRNLPIFASGNFLVPKPSSTWPCLMCVHLCCMCVL